MAKTKVAVSLDAALLAECDALVRARAFASRSGAIEAALADQLARLKRTRLSRECAKLDARTEAAEANEGLREDLASWPAY
jgi:metal-responsive CopG/Arc/MetJ family transcriptional regulator